MSRQLLSAENVSPNALSFISNYHQEVVAEVSKAVLANKIVVVGMSYNPFVSKARKLLTSAGLDFTFLCYGGYLSNWKPRLAIKLWSGWPTYPQVFVNGKLIGGFNELEKEFAAGNLKK